MHTHRNHDFENKNGQKHRNLTMIERRVMERRTELRAPAFCLSVAISAVLLLHLGHCHGLQPQHNVFDPHKVDAIVLGNRYGVTNFTTDRRKILRQCFGFAVAFGIVGSSPQLSFASSSAPNDSVVQHPFAYSDSWTGTNLNIMSLEESTKNGVYAKDESGLYWAMGKWPDPALRIPAKPIDPKMWLVEGQQQRLELAATILRDTANREGAVGLAAQQCGVDARMAFLSSSGERNGNPDMVLINPRIVARSDESKMKVWTEECLVLPPTFRATVLRDDWIDVEYDFLYEYRSKEIISSAGSQTPIKRRFFKEQSRCLQHELDHDRGILITDHVGLDELEDDVMRKIEAEDHDKRQVLAYSRQ